MSRSTSYILTSCNSSHSVRNSGCPIVRQLTRSFGVEASVPSADGPPIAI